MCKLDFIFKMLLSLDCPIFTSIPFYLHNGALSSPTMHDRIRMHSKGDHSRMSAKYFTHFLLIVLHNKGFFLYMTSHL